MTKLSVVASTLLACAFVVPVYPQVLGAEKAPALGTERNPYSWQSKCGPHEIPAGSGGCMPDPNNPASSAGDIKWSDLFRSHSGFTGAREDCNDVRPVNGCTGKDGEIHACPAKDWQRQMWGPWINIAQQSGLKYGCRGGTVDAFLDDFRWTQCARLFEWECEHHEYVGINRGTFEESLKRIQEIQDSLGLPDSMRVEATDCRGAVLERFQKYGGVAGQHGVSCAIVGRSMSLSLAPGMETKPCPSKSSAGRQCETLTVSVRGKPTTFAFEPSYQIEGASMHGQAAWYLSRCDNRLAERALEAIGTKYRAPWTKADLEIIRDSCLTAAAMIATPDVSAWATAVAAAYDQVIAGKRDPQAPPIPYLRRERAAQAVSATAETDEAADTARNWAELQRQLWEGDRKCVALRNGENITPTDPLSPASGTDFARWVALYANGNFVAAYSKFSTPGPRKACDATHWYGLEGCVEQDRMGVMQYNGCGTGRSASQAYITFTDAARGHYVDALVHAAWMNEGNGKEKDITSALRLYDEAASLNFAPARDAAQRIRQEVNRAAH